MTTDPSEVRVQPVIVAKLPHAATINNTRLGQPIPSSRHHFAMAAARAAIVSPKAFTMNEWPFDGRDAANQAL